MSDVLCSLAGSAPVVLVAIVVGLHIYFRMRSAPARAAMTQRLRTDTIAQRLGLSIVEGDPAFVFVDVGGQSGTRRRVVLRGERAGTPLELVYAYQRTDRASWGEVHVSTTFECRVTAYARQPFPCFEVMSLLPGIPQREPLLPRAGTGHPGADGALIVKTQEPAMAELLGRILPQYAPAFAMTGMHVHGDGSAVSFLMHQKVAPHPAAALENAETIAELVVALGRAVGG